MINDVEAVDLTNVIRDAQKSTRKWTMKSTTVFVQWHKNLCKVEMNVRNAIGCNYVRVVSDCRKRKKESAQLKTIF